MKTLNIRLGLILIFIIPSLPSFCQSNQIKNSDLVEIIQAIRNTTINHLNSKGHRYSENAQIPIVFFDGARITKIDSLNCFKLSDIQDITISYEQDPKLVALYGGIVTYGIILVRRKKE